MNRHMFQKTLKQMDIFAKPVELLIKKEEGHRTLLGALMTLGLFATLSILLWNKLSELLNHTNPQSFSNKLYTEKPELVWLQAQNFTIQFDFQDIHSMPYLNKSIYIVEAFMMHKHSVKNENGSINVVFDATPLPVKVCTLDNYQQVELKNYFIAFDPSLQYCIDWEQIDSIPLQGSFDNDEFFYVQFQIKLCNDETCPDKEFIKNFTASNYFSMQMSSTNLDLKDPYHPHSSVGKDFYTSASSKMYKQIDIYFNYIITETDFGIFGSDITIDKSLAFSRSEERVLLSESDLLLNVVLRLDNYQNYNYRQYQKLQDIFGQIGGIWQVLFTLVLFLYTPIRNLSYRIQIINSLFNFEDKSEQVSEIQVSQRQFESSNFIGLKKGLQRSRTSIMNQSNSIIMQFKSMKDISKGLKQYLSSNKKKLKLINLEYIIFCCNCEWSPLKNKERTKILRDQIDYSANRVSKSLDILYIIKKLNEIDKLKVLLLTRDQINVFDYLPKPTISLHPFSSENQSDHHKYFSILKREKSDYQNAIDAQKSYHNIANNLKDPINQKLLEFLGTQIQDLFSIGNHQPEAEIENRSGDFTSQIEENNTIRESDNKEQIHLQIRNQVLYVNNNDD